LKRQRNSKGDDERTCNDADKVVGGKRPRVEVGDEWGHLGERSSQNAEDRQGDVPCPPARRHGLGEVATNPSVPNGENFRA